MEEMMEFRLWIPPVSTSPGLPGTRGKGAQRALHTACLHALSTVGAPSVGAALVP